MSALPQLDSCARLHVGSRRRIGSYFALGLLGTAVGATIATVSALANDHTVSLPALLTVTAIVSFVAGVKLGQVLVGYERIVLYELFLLALAADTAALAIADLPIREGLDIAVIGVGTMLVFGRIGCLRVGCCHGRPARWGIVYGDEHVRAGFPARYGGVRLFPVQLVESALTAAIVSAALLAYAWHPPGEALCLYVSVYGVIRFGLELLRGDADRQFLVGASEAQWLALITCWAAAATASTWSLPLLWLYITVAAALTAAFAAAIIVDRTLRFRPWWFRHPHQTHELESALHRLLANVGDSVRVADTAAGLRLSASRDGDNVLLAFSCSTRAFSMADAQALAEEVGRVTRRPVAPPEPGRSPGLFYVLVRFGAVQPSPPGVTENVIS